MQQAAIAKLEPYLRSVLRVIVGFTFSLHGFQKLFGVLGRSAAAEPFTLAWTAGVMEALGGTLIVAGLYTRPTAFLLSGQMAVAYFRSHAGRGFWPVENGGELAAVYSFVFLWLCAAGGGPLSLDRLVRKRA